MEDVRVVKRVVFEGMVDGEVSSGVEGGRGRDWKNGRETGDMVMEPWWLNWCKAEYSCSAAAWVVRYHGFPPM